jgi:hypothetical protein
MKKIPLTILFCLCIDFLSAQNVGDYQSAGSGNWNTVAVWQTWNGTAWVTPGGTPNNTSGMITILAGHTITVPAALNVDELTVNGTMNTSAGIVLTVSNGTGVDLQINGTFGDMSTASISWNAGATWQMGASGTLIKTTASSSNNWQSTYQGGIATIPSTANWILRKSANPQPALSTTTPASGAVYPNLTIENNTANAWIAPAGSSFTGTTARATIKGNLDIGGSGTNVVDFLSSNTFASGILVQGNLLIRSGNSLRNYGTGFEVQGDVIINGVLMYDSNDGRNFVFSGSNNQTFSGTGWPYIYNMTMAKSSGTLTLNRNLSVDNLLTMTTGIIISTSSNLLIVNSAATTSGASNNSFVSGPVRYLGNSAFTYPVGKGSDYQPLATSAWSATLSPFWTEDFNNGCASLCLASAYSGVNGAWTLASTGTNDASASQFYVSCEENGNAVGACGTGCAGDATLHVANVAGSPLAGFFCPPGDCGAAYDAGLGGTAVRTSRRMESPSINCTGHYNVQVVFKYMEGGENIADNATFWYFDGSAWSQQADMAKTVLCSGQGTWTAYMVSLPASANNNANIKIGFQWVNNDNGAGADPSFAVDNVSLRDGEFFTAEYFYADPQVVYNNNLAPTLSSISACEYWILDRAQSSPAATSVTLTWDGNSCPAIPQVSDTRVAHFDLVTWQDEGNGGNTGTTAAGTVTSAAPVTYFSPFTIGLIPTTPLPIEMLRFDGSCTGNHVLLKWSTATETDNDFFTVERSVDGSAFSAIGNLDGAGNSTQVLNYHFDDPDAVGGTNYYRIKQTDYNGHYSYSNIIVVDAKACEDKNLQLVNTFFNADDLEIDYRHANGPVTIEIYNAEGRVVDKITDLPPASNHHINAAGWSRSIYFIRVTDGMNAVSGTILR